MQTSNYVVHPLEMMLVFPNKMQVAMLYIGGIGSFQLLSSLYSIFIEFNIHHEFYLEVLGDSMAKGLSLLMRGVVFYSLSLIDYLSNLPHKKRLKKQTNGSLEC